ncbi:hypothetical protein [Nocardia wallacei]|uniref:hypothetical protein n=1 Tax=Nocardia wallacei TaxID=480035 RepID=UPI002455DE03|nr:hypothetical protein [Nocardia wallacei]
MNGIDIDRRVDEAVKKALADIDRRPVALDLAGAMQYSGLSKTALNDLLRQELVVARKFGTKNLFDRESLDRYIRSLPAWGTQ